WDPKEMGDPPITVWEPMRAMQTASEMPSKDGRMVRLAIDYYVEVHGGRVRVRLVHSGFDDSDSWDGYIDGLDAGWTFFLFNLKHALERHRGVDRLQLSARSPTTAPGRRAAARRGMSSLAWRRRGRRHRRRAARAAHHRLRSAGVERRAPLRRTRGGGG